MSGSEGTACYTVRLRLRVTKQRTQRVGKLLISNLRPRRAAQAAGALCQDVAVDEERYCSLSLPDMMSK